MKSGDFLASKYRLVQRIGEGAMGEVWAGENLSTGRKVALKLIIRSASKQNTHDLRHRLLREARACGKLSHRNIVQIYDVGETPEGDPFLVLELLRGRTLGERLKDTRRIDPTMTARIGADIASALAAAHAAKIIHRDLKPANIFLHNEENDPDERFVVKVLDFGVCKNIDGTTDGPATITNVAVGSPVYMSPEQVAMYKDLDGRTDIWSLGVVLYEMLTGGRPFTGSVDDVVRQIILTRINKVPAPSTKVRDVSTEFDAIVARCLENDRASRFGDAAELARVLGAIADMGVPMRVSGNISRPGVFAAGQAATETDVPDETRLPGTQPLLAINETQGPTGTQLMSAKQVISSPAPEWRREMAEWRAQRDAIAATRAASIEALHGGTQAIDPAPILSALNDNEPTATTSALGALSQPDFESPGASVSAIASTKRRRSSRMLFAMTGAGVLAAMVVLALMVNAALFGVAPAQVDIAAPFDSSSLSASATIALPHLPQQPENVETSQAEPISSAITAPSASSAPVPVVPRAPVKPANVKPKPAMRKPLKTICTRTGGKKTCTTINEPTRLFPYYSPSSP